MPSAVKVRVCRVLLLAALSLGLTGLTAGPAAAIYGGQPLGERAPWLVLLDVEGGVCTGVLIAPQRVLTAGHCVADHRGRRVRKLQVGWGSSDLYQLQWQPVPRDAIQLLPSYAWKRGGVYGDLARVELPQPWPGPVAPLDNMRPPRGARSAVQSGWGVTQEWAYPIQAQWTDSRLWADAACRGRLRSQGMDWQRSATWLCAGEPGPVRQARVACWGDSGGPLLVRGRVVGILSWFYSPDQGDVRDCASGPMYYLRLRPRLLRWALGADGLGQA